MALRRWRCGSERKRKSAAERRPLLALASDATVEHVDGKVLTTSDACFFTYFYPYAAKRFL
jgi:hypothetical protein